MHIEIRRIPRSPGISEISDEISLSVYVSVVINHQYDESTGRQRVAHGCSANLIFIKTSHKRAIDCTHYHYISSGLVQRIIIYLLLGQFLRAEKMPHRNMRLHRQHLLYVDVGTKNKNTPSWLMTNYICTVTDHYLCSMQGRYWVWTSTGCFQALCLASGCVQGTWMGRDLSRIEGKRGIPVTLFPGCAWHV